MSLGAGFMVVSKGSAGASRSHTDSAGNVTLLRESQ